MAVKAIKVKRVFVFSDGTEKKEAEMTETEVLEARKSITSKFLDSLNLQKVEENSRVV